MQHFLLSAAARTLSLKAVFRMGEDQAYQTFCQLRWPETEGEAVCPRCGCVETYNITSRRRFKCVACHHQFSVTSGTIFASRKLSFTDLLAAIVIFVNGAKGVSALQVSRDLDVQYKTAFVLSHKLREAMAREQAGRTLGGVVEIDGAYFGGYSKPENKVVDRKDRRLKANLTGKRQCVVIMRERDGRSLPFVVRHEGDAVPIVRDRVGTLATIHADEGSGWDALHAGWETHRINHSVAFMDEGVCTNQAESFFSRLSGESVLRALLRKGVLMLAEHFHFGKIFYALLETRSATCPANKHRPPEPERTDERCPSRPRGRVAAGAAYQAAGACPACLATSQS